MIKWFGSSAASSSSPVPNSYWVEPGRLLAGEYPGGSGSDARDRIHALLDAGFTSFIDLTAEGELPPYHLELASRNAVHRRFPITDHGIPDSPALMSDVVAAIVEDLAEGRRVYVHCRAGIGRTGMAVGCYLIHQGLDGSAALEKLQKLWQKCARARSWPSIPETEQQVSFVRAWIASDNRADSAAQRAEGALLGLAIGEGLAFAMHGHPTSEAAWTAESKRLERLTAGADTATTLAAIESLLERGGHDGNDQLRRYLAWTQQPGMQARVPPELKRALAAWQWSRKPSPGSHDPKNLDAHTLARALAAALVSKGDVHRATELAVEVSRTTLQSPLVLDACRVWAAELTAALNGTTKADLVALRAAREAMQQRQLKPQISALLQGDWQHVAPTDGVLAALASAFDIFRFTHSFEAAIREGARVGTTPAALVGELAGAYYGARAIPSEWRRAVADGERIATLAHRFVR